MNNTPMFKSFDEESDRRWNPFSAQECMRIGNTAFGEWKGYPYDTNEGNLPNHEQIDTVTCREYTQCSEYMAQYVPQDDRIRMSCEAYSGINIGCKRKCYCLKT